jgi:hypothetical protein
MQMPAGLKPWNDPLFWPFLWPFVLAAAVPVVYITISVVSMFVLTSGPPSSWPSYAWQVVGLLYLIPVGILAIGLLSYVARRRAMSPAAIDAALASRRKESTSRLLQLGVLLVMLSLVMPLQYLYMHPPSTQPSSWEAQLAAAQAEARKVNPAMVLDSIRAEPINSYKITHIDADTTFSVEFTFLRPSGEATTVTILDTDPPRLVEVRSDRWMGGPPQNEDQRAAQAQRLRTIQLSPRELYRRTLAEGLAFGQLNGSVTPRLYLFLGPDQQARSGSRMSWGVEYDASHHTLYLDVDPATGQVLAREERTW